RHPHIVKVLDFGIENNIYYMVMDYLAGETLKQHIQQNPQIHPTEVLRLIAQIADALDYAHNKGMVHRDLKPANIMFEDQAHQHAVLTDFGIARIVGQKGMTMT